MDLDIVLGIKRKCSSPSQIKSSKRKRETQSHVNILELSDCTLLHILQYLDAASLYTFGRTCIRFNQLVCDESLWIHVDARRKPNDNSKAKFCWENVNKRTKAILLAGRNRSDFIISLNVMINSDVLSNLTVLALEHQCIKYCRLKEFPPSLEELSLRHSFVPHHSDFFRFAQDGMSNLKALILDHCQWLEANSLIPLSRLPKLEIVSLYMCKKLGDDDISDVSLAGKFGFKTLKVIDLRFTGLGENFLKTFYKSESLQCIYFQNFSHTYQLERSKRKLDILKGEKILENCYISDDESNNDGSKYSFKKRFKIENLVATETQNIRDSTMAVFDCLQPNEHLPKPKSYLYTYPYGECTCEFFDKEKGTYRSRPIERGVETEIDDLPDGSGDEEIVWDARRLKRHVYKETSEKKGEIFFMQPMGPRLCHSFAFDCCTMPSWCQIQSHPTNCHHRWLYAREPRNDFEIAMLEHTDKNYKIRAIRSSTANCDCGICLEDTIGVIVISRNEEGRVIHYSPSLSKSGETSNRPTETTNAEIHYLISKLAKYFTNFEHSTIREVLATFNKCSKSEDSMLNVTKLLDDKEFVQSLYESLLALSKYLSENCIRILSYHHGCFGALLCKLLKDKHSEKQKKVLKLFFRNLLCSVNGEELFTQEDKSISFEDSWNLPGPSGLPSGCSVPSTSSEPESNDNNKDDRGENERKTKRSFQTMKDGEEQRSPPEAANDFFVHPHFNVFFEMNVPQGIVQVVGPRNNVVFERLHRNIPSFIKELSLRGYQVTDATLRILKGLELDLLDVTNTSVTVQGVEDFIKSNPQCRLIHESACICRPKLHF